MTREKFYPAGRILSVRGLSKKFGGLLLNTNSNITLSEVPSSNFGEMTIQRGMLDLLLHTPTGYETILTQIWENTRK